MAKELKNTAVYVAYDDIDPYDPATPEKNLLKAILLSALADLRRPGDVGRKATKFFLNPKRDYIFSFTSICEYLGIDPRRILRVTGLASDKSAPADGPKVDSLLQ